MTSEQRTEKAVLADALEAVLARIQGIRAARVVSGDGRISEIHIVSSTDRAPKQLVRDIQSAAKASFDLDLDYRTVSIVQIDDDAVPPPTISVGTVRLPLVRVVESTSGQLGSIEVVLKQDDLELIGRARGSASKKDELIARATLQAIESLLTETVGEVVGVETATIKSTSVALVVVRLVSPTGTKLISGSAVVGADEGDAIARATLDAINRVAG